MINTAFYLHEVFTILQKRTSFSFVFPLHFVSLLLNCQVLLFFTIIIVYDLSFLGEVQFCWWALSWSGMISHSNPADAQQIVSPLNWVLSDLGELWPSQNQMFRGISCLVAQHVLSHRWAGEKPDSETFKLKVNLCGKRISSQSRGKGDINICWVHTVYQDAAVYLPLEQLCSMGPFWPILYSLLPLFA